MKSICINYVTSPECAEENKQLVKEIFQQLQERNLTGVKYAAFKMGENIFVHFAQFESEEACEAFRSLPAFLTFQKNLNNRLTSEPLITSTTEIGTYITLDNLSADGNM